MTFVEDSTRYAVWATLCDLEWNVRYYTVMARRCRRRYFTLRIALLGSIVVEGTFHRCGIVGRFT